LNPEESPFVSTLFEAFSAQKKVTKDCIFQRLLKAISAPKRAKKTAS
jgi:hypothetical protein